MYRFVHHAFVEFSRLGSFHGQEFVTHHVRGTGLKYYNCVISSYRYQFYPAIGSNGANCCRIERVVEPDNHIDISCDLMIKQNVDLVPMRSFV
jgi:hypothetical protein